MASLNRVTLLGNLGKDPEGRTTTAGKQVANFSLATKAGFGEGAGTDWHQIVVWEKQAELALKYLTKGSPVLVEGRLTYRTYEHDGVTKYITEIVASNLTLLGAGPAKTDKTDESVESAEEKPRRATRKAKPVADDADAFA